MYLSKILVGLRFRIRYLRYVCSQSRKNSGTFSQAMTEALLLNPHRHPVMMGPEELSRFFVYSANRRLRSR